jgi:hypothetical protein
LPRHHVEQRTAGTKECQNNKLDMPAGGGVVMPEQVSVAMAEIAGAMGEGLLALAVGAGTGGEARRDPAPVADRAGSAPERADDFVGAAATAEQA